jgi:glycosyltransferase involved in cell wall biosynthesis
LASLSILIACRNHARYLRRSIDSVLAQTRLPDEILLIDDASSDETSAIMTLVAARDPARIRFVRNTTNVGLIGVVQQGVDAMTGDYVTFCAADDWLFPDFCEKAMRLLEAHPQAAIFNSLGRSIDDAGRDLGLDSGPVPTTVGGYLSPSACRAFILENDSWFLGYTAVYRREALRALGRYDPSLGSFFDNFVSRMLVMRHGACFIPEPLAAARKASETYSATVSSDPEKMIAIGQRAAELMRTIHADVVPDAYLSVFERRFRYLMGSSVVHWSSVEIARRLALATGRDGAFGLPGIFKLAALVAKAVMFIAYRHVDALATFRRWLLRRQFESRWPPRSFDRLV